VRKLLPALLAACAARPVLPVPAPEVALAERPFAPAAAPATGAFDSATSTRVDARIVAGGRELRLRAFCRDGVWTTLDRRDARAFVVRESWGKLGERRPRLLARVADDLVTGVVLRVRPERDGTLAYRVEVSAGEVGPDRPAGTFEGVEVSLPRPRRHGYRFAGVLPAGGSGRVARWGDAVEVHLFISAPSSGPGRVTAFEAEGVLGEVAGELAEAEAFVEEWELVPPVFVDAEGVKRGDFRLVPRRRAAGLRLEAGGAAATYGGVRARA
jgi:hypothetical protein